MVYDPPPHGPHQDAAMLRKLGDMLSLQFYVLGFLCLVGGLFQLRTAFADQSATTGVMGLLVTFTAIVTTTLGAFVTRLAYAVARLLERQGPGGPGDREREPYTDYDRFG